MTGNDTTLTSQSCQGKDYNNLGNVLDLTTQGDTKAEEGGVGVLSCVQRDAAQPGGFSLPSDAVKVNPTLQEAPGRNDSYQADQLDPPRQAHFDYAAYQEQERAAGRRAWLREDNRFQKIADQAARDYNFRQDLKNEWAFFLNEFDWNWYGHFTFRYDAHPESALKTFRKWTHLLNRKLFGCKYYKRGQGIQYVLGIEYQKRGVIHFHSLLAGAGLLMDKDAAGNTQRLFWMERWNELAGFARIKGYVLLNPMTLRKSAERYISKYICKGGTILISDTMKPVAMQPAECN